jgi:uncharacterized protein
VEEAVTLPDVNVLIYAFRSDANNHAVSRRWLDRTVESPSSFGISRLTLSAVVRVTTNVGYYGGASSLDDAFGFCADLMAQPHCILVEPGARHWAIFERLCRETDTTGPRVTDAWFAALAIEHGCEWVTFDRDFARFPSLKWSVPG